MIRQTAAAGVPPRRVPRETPGPDAATANPDARCSTWNPRAGTGGDDHNSPPAGPPSHPGSRDVRILCLGMSALDANYRVPAIPAPDQDPRRASSNRRRDGAANASVAVARLGGVDTTGARRRRRAGARESWPSSPPTASMSAPCDGFRVRVAVGGILVADDGERWSAPTTIRRLDADPAGCANARPRFAACWPTCVAGRRGGRRGRAGRPPVAVDGDVGPPAAVGRTRATGDARRLFEPGWRRRPGAIPAQPREDRVDGARRRRRNAWRRRVPVAGPRDRAARLPFRSSRSTRSRAGDVWHGAFTLALGRGQTSRRRRASPMPPRRSSARDRRRQARPGPTSASPDGSRAVASQVDRLKELIV